MSVAQIVLRQRTAADVVGLGAGAAVLFVPAIVKMPIAFQLWTARATDLPRNIRPSRSAVLLHVAVGDLVRDALVAERRHQPVEYRTGISVADCRLDLVGPEVRSDLVDQCCRACQATNGMDQPDRMVEGRTLPILYFGMILVSGLTTREYGRGRRHHATQIIDTSLRCASVSPSMYRCVV